MKLDFVKISPTENMTILVKTAVPTEQQLAVGAKLIDYSSFMRSRQASLKSL